MMQYEEELFGRALAAAANSYSPYSRFRVGAAILCDDGSIVTGANIENRSYGLTICAERSAVASAVSSGRKGFRMIAIATPDSSYPVSPCGACRQVLSEFFPPEAKVRFGASFESSVESTVRELFPFDALHDLAR